MKEKIKVGVHTVICIQTEVLRNLRPKQHLKYQIIKKANSVSKYIACNENYYTGNRVDCLIFFRQSETAGNSIGTRVMRTDLNRHKNIAG